MNKGWIALHRSTQDHWLWKEKRKFSKAEAWLDVLMSAAHKKYTSVINDNVITCERGQWVASVRFLQARWQWSNSKVVRFLNVLKKSDMLEVKKETGITVLEVSNYNDYQTLAEIKKTPKRQKKDSKKTPRRHQGDEDNNDNNENKLISVAEVDFINYIVTKLPEINPDWTAAQATRAAKSRYETYVANNWKDGNNKKIVNWKLKAINAIKHEKPWSYGSEPKPTNGNSITTTDANGQSRIGGREYKITPASELELK